MIRNAISEFIHGPAVARTYLKAFKQVFKQATKVKHAVRMLTSDDPWMPMRAFGIKNFNPIQHEQNDSQPITLEVQVCGQTEQIEAFVVSKVRPLVRRKDRASAGDPYAPSTGSPEHDAALTRAFHLSFDHNQGTFPTRDMSESAETTPSETEEDEYELGVVSPPSPPDPTLQGAMLKDTVKRIMFQPPKPSTWERLGFTRDRVQEINVVMANGTNTCSVVSDAACRTEWSVPVDTDR